MNKVSPIRLIIGLLIIIIGVSLLLSGLGMPGLSEIIAKLWPVSIILLGVAMLFTNRQHYLWAILVIAIGNILQLNALDLIDVNIWQLIWPVIIIVIGVSIIANRLTVGDGASKKVSKDVSDDVTAILSGSEQHNRSDDFKFSKITAVLGGVTYDMSKVSIKKEATIEILTLMGGVELRVPETVEVRCSTMNILGGVENKTAKPTAKNAPVLNIIGDVVMAGIEIKN